MCLLQLLLGNCCEWRKDQRNAALASLLFFGLVLRLAVRVVAVGCCLLRCVNHLELLVLSLFARLIPGGTSLSLSLFLSLAVSRCVAVEASRQSTVGYFTTTASKAKIPTNHKMQGPFFVFVSVCVCASFAAALFGCCVGRRIDSLSLRIDRRCSFLDSVFARRGKTHTVPVPLLRTRSEQKRGKNRTVRDRTSCCEPWPNNFSPSHLPSRGQKRETLTTPTTPTTPTSAHTYTRTRGERETEDSDSRVCAEWD